LLLRGEIIDCLTQLSSDVSVPLVSSTAFSKFAVDVEVEVEVEAFFARVVLAAILEFSSKYSAVACDIK
jgi:hypothetical protein